MWEQVLKVTVSLEIPTPPPKHPSSPAPCAEVFPGKLSVHLYYKLSCHHNRLVQQWKKWRYCPNPPVHFLLHSSRTRGEVPRRLVMSNIKRVVQLFSPPRTNSLRLRGGVCVLFLFVTWRCKHIIIIISSIKWKSQLNKANKDPSETKGKKKNLALTPLMFSETDYNRYLSV